MLVVPARKMEESLADATAPFFSMLSDPPKKKKKKKQRKIELEKASAPTRSRRAIPNVSREVQRRVSDGREFGDGGSFRERERRRRRRKRESARNNNGDLGHH